MQVALAPIGLADLNARRGEVQAARAAAAAAIPFCLSTLSVCSLAEVARASSQPLRLQLYMIRDRGLMAAQSGNGADGLIGSLLK
jgi:L-lactate dehydrogenase (cytochrome)